MCKEKEEFILSIKAVDNTDYNQPGVKSNNNCK